ncbi:MAG: DNA polymerase IV [bacterium]|nr:DNA polymerase IV [bacterium]
MILHVDMDAFYASVEERENPKLKSHPLIVGGSPEGRGVVSAANYAAREYGIHSAMPARRALQLCPRLNIVRPRMRFYAEISHQIRDIFHRYTPLVEPLSLDEAFLDVSGSQRLFGSAEQIARRIKADIHRELRLIASVGVAPNKFLAKLASDLEKPDGFTVVPADNVQPWLDPLPISRIWGVGRVTAGKFESVGIHTFGQLRALGKETARQLFGSVGEHFWKLSQGIDSRTVTPERKAKSISHETTFAIDVGDRDILASRLLELTEQVAERLRRSGLRGRTICLKLRYSDFHTLTRSYTFQRATHATDRLWPEVSRLLHQTLPQRKLEVRLVGVGVSGLEKQRPIQLGLFENPSEIAAELKSADLDAATDRIRREFGHDALKRASTLRSNKDRSDKEHLENEDLGKEHPA